MPYSILLITFPFLGRNPQHTHIKGGREVLFWFTLSSRFSPWLAGFKAEIAWWKAVVENSCSPVVGKKQREQGKAGTGMHPSGSHLSDHLLQPSPTSKHKNLGDILNLNHNQDSDIYCTPSGEPAWASQCPFASFIGSVYVGHKR